MSGALLLFAELDVDAGLTNTKFLSCPGPKAEFILLRTDPGNHYNKNWFN